MTNHRKNLGKTKSKMEAAQAVLQDYTVKYKQARELVSKEIVENESTLNTTVKELGQRLQLTIAQLGKAHEETVAQLNENHAVKKLELKGLLDEF